MSNPPNYARGIHLLATVLAGYVVLLITAGGLVKSLEAGLSVPDWPLSYGMLNPPRWWEIETVRAEHGHRLIAGVALILTVILTVWIARREGCAGPELSFSPNEQMDRACCGDPSSVTAVGGSLPGPGGTMGGKDGAELNLR